jgi:arylsulfatase A-like enzyme
VPRRPLLAFAVATLIGLSSACAPVEEPPPNVVLITLDTIRADHLSCYGYERPTSPHLDHLASEGTRFDAFVNASSWTLPSHASLFTGLSPTTHGAHYAAGGAVSLDQAIDQKGPFGAFRVDALPDQAETLAERLADAGYATGGVGAGPWLKPAFGLAQGFDTYDAEVASTSGRPGEEVNALALRFLTEHGDEPFFLFVNYFDAHDPYEPPPDLAGRFLPLETKASRSAHTLARYDEEILHVDRCLGELLEALRETGVYDRTWIVAVTDHGELFDEHGLPGHGRTLYEGETRGALVIKPPADFARNLDGSVPCQHVDLAPTLLAGVGLPRPVDMEGAPLWEQPSAPVAELFPNPAYARAMQGRFERQLRAVHDGGFKLIVSDVDDARDTGLFDLATDPLERNDLTHIRPDVLERLQARLQDWARGLAPPLEPETVGDVDPATLKQLQALGYVAPERDG